MDRRLLPVSILLLFIGPASAQITTGHGSTRSIPEMINHLLGINVYNPYEILGITATFGVLWVSTYVIFKVGIKRIDEGLDRNGRGESGLQGALGVDDSNSRNVLAILTLLIVLTTIGTGAFLEIIRGWQSLIILAFLFALLAGLFFVIFGGTGAVVGGTAYAAGASAQVTAGGIEQLQEGLNRIGNLEDEVDDQEDGDETEDEAEYTEEEIEEIIEALEDAENDLNDLTAQEIRELADAIENLEEIIELLNLDD
ncbi:MAG: hypothetical protein J07AB43_16960 [Candidatus Nanosalina sp. J07AB43]|nr:MAG: hypothetical protein J07AB43_16960 [Candidatus Nanosalina sp. J07AB43]